MEFISETVLESKNAAKQWPHIFAYMGVREINMWLQKRLCCEHVLTQIIY